MSRNKLIGYGLLLVFGLVAPFLFSAYKLQISIMWLLVVLSLTWDTQGGQMGYNSFGNISCVMTETGDLYPCEILNRKIGGIRETGYNFSKLYYSKNAEEIRQFIKGTKCYCTYECAITTNILFNIKQLIKMLVK